MGIIAGRRTSFRARSRVRKRARAPALGRARPWARKRAGALAALLLALASAPALAWVAVDVGHTLEVPGARSARGRPEFEFNLPLARDLVAALGRAGIEGRLVNGDGRIGSLSARARAAAG